MSQRSPLAEHRLAPIVMHKVSKPEPSGENIELFRLLVESVKDYAIFVLDPDGHVLTWNEGAQAIKGYTSNEIIGQHFSKFYLPEAVQSGWASRARARVARARR